MAFAPKGAIGLSLGFQPWEPSKQMVRPEGREMRTPLTCVVATFDLAPLQGAPPWDGVPGVKPRAEPSRPLRGEETSQTLIIFAPFSPGFQPINADLMRAL